MLCGPSPFTAEELAIVEARRQFSWRLVGVTASGEVMYEVTNGSDRRLPFLSILTASGTPATLHVDVADDGDERDRGLMGVEQLPRDQGMAFVWDEPVTTTFWMKDTLVPLSIAFWDTDGRIIDILDMEPCTGDPCPTYRPDAPYVGAVEANAGWFAEHGVGVGDHVELEVRAYA